MLISLKTRFLWVSLKIFFELLTGAISPNKEPLSKSKQPKHFDKPQVKTMTASGVTTCFCWCNAIFKSEEKFWVHWIPESRQFFLQFYYKIDKGDMRAGKVTHSILHLAHHFPSFRASTQTCQRRWINLRLPRFLGSLPFPSLVLRETSKKCPQHQFCLIFPLIECKSLLNLKSGIRKCPVKTTA